MPEPASLRTTWVSLRLSSGTKTIMSPATRVWQARRMPAAMASAPSRRTSVAETGDAQASGDVSPATVSWPASTLPPLVGISTRTLHLPQAPLPPHALSISTPTLRATVRRSWPDWAAARRPDG